MDEQELNKKLTEWAGFQESVNLPSFTQSLDTCFRWLVAKFNNPIMEFECRPSGWFVRFNGMSKAQAETPALAFCLAIEKLIDGEKNE